LGVGVHNWWETQNVSTRRKYTIGDIVYFLGKSIYFAAILVNPDAVAGIDNLGVDEVQIVV
jgi:hypothetical protein